MISFIQYLLEEPRWHKPQDTHTKFKRIPFSSKLLSSFINADMWHISGKGSIIDHQGKQSVFSTSTLPHPCAACWTTGEWIFLINGNVSIGGKRDIMSRPDENGIRWLDMYDAWDDSTDKPNYEKDFASFNSYLLKQTLGLSDDQIDEVKSHMEVSETFDDLLAVSKYIVQCIQKNILTYVNDTPNKYRERTTKNYDEFLTDTVQVKVAYYCSVPRGILADPLLNIIKTNTDGTFSDEQIKFMKSFIKGNVIIMAHPGKEFFNELNNTISNVPSSGSGDVKRWVKGVMNNTKPLDSNIESYIVISDGGYNDAKLSKEIYEHALYNISQINPPKLISNHQ